MDGDPNFHVQHLWDDIVDVKRDLVEAPSQELSGLLSRNLNEISIEKKPCYWVHIPLMLT